MFNSNLTAKRIWLKVLLAIVAGAWLATAAAGQTPNAEERQRAIDLYESSEYTAALPLLEKVAQANPNDTVILSRLGFVLYAVSTAEKNAATRQQMRDRARTILLRSKSLGDDSNLTAIALDALSSKDVADIPFSNIRAADAALREGETAFVRGELDKALSSYKHALELDPSLYEAALYAGDMEFKKAFNSTDPQFRNDHFDAAGVWFAKAIAIDPNRETAYRYWGDALDAQGKTDDARIKFVDAIVAEPYGRRAYVGLTQWGERHQVALGHPKIEVPSNVTSAKPGETTITIDPSTLTNNDDGSAAWIMYGIARANWMNKKDGSRSEKFARAYPNELQYRHSLAEEVDGLRLVAESVQTQMKEKRVKQLTISLDNLMKLSNAGLLEPFILFARPDEGVARDYAAYRATNREKLRRYWLEVVIIK